MALDSRLFAGTIHLFSRVSCGDIFFAVFDQFWSTYPHRPRLCANIYASTPIILNIPIISPILGRTISSLPLQSIRHHDHALCCYLLLLSSGSYPAVTTPMVREPPILAAHHLRNSILGLLQCFLIHSLPSYSSASRCIICSCISMSLTLYCFRLLFILLPKCSHDLLVVLAILVFLVFLVF